MNNGKRGQRFFCLACLVLLSGLSLYTACRKKVVYTYDLESLEAIKPEMICYSETARIPLDFKQCLGLAADNDTIYVTGDNRLRAFKPDGSLPRECLLPGQARCLAVSASALYLGMSDYVAVYDLDCNETGTWAALGEKAIITSLAAGGDSVYAADAGNRVVACYTVSGRLERFIEGTGGNGFIIPSSYFDLVLDLQNTPWVVNPGNHSLEHYTREGELLGAWGTGGFTLAAFSGCCNPIHIAMLPGGGFVTVEKGITRVKIYNSAGEFQCAIAAPMQFKANVVIADLAVRPNGDILLLDPSLPAPAVRIFSRKPDNR